MTAPLTLGQAAHELRSGRLTSVELTTRMLQVADALDPTVGVFISRFDETALAVAAERDRELADGIVRGPLHGIPVGIKDIISTTEAPATAQSRALSPEWGRSIGDATVVTRLRDSGAVILGKLTTMEFAAGFIREDNPYAVPRNPWDLDRWPGGSSSGSGSGVSTGMMLGALGTDTGGSIRTPSSFCGVTGLKPTWGAVPTDGCAPLAWSEDVIGPMARSAWDCAAMFDAMADASTMPQLENTDLSGLTVGIFRGAHRTRDDSDPAVDPAIDGVRDTLHALGASTVEIDLPNMSVLAGVGSITGSMESYAWHRNNLRERWDDYGASLKDHLVKGLLLSAGDYVQFNRVRAVHKRMLMDIFSDVDAVLMTTSHIPAPTVDELVQLDPSFTAPWSTVGCPVLNIPMGKTASGLPLGAQIATAVGADALALRIGHAYQTRTDWHLAVPPLAASIPHS